MQNLANDLDDVAKFSLGLLSARPAPTPSGRFYYATDVPLLYVATGSAWYEVNPAARLFNPGDLKATVVEIAPTGWLVCNGQSYLRASFPDLFTALGGSSSPYGLPDSTHFNVPDLRGCVALGAGQGPNLSARVRGGRGGKEAHRLSSLESGTNGNHRTTATDRDSAKVHSHAGLVSLYRQDATNFPQGAGPDGGLALMGDRGGTTQFTQEMTSANIDHNHPLNAQDADLPHENMPPFLVVNWIIKT
jgi:microcystin-dependent protein